MDNTLENEYDNLRKKYLSDSKQQCSCPICGSVNLQKEFRDIIRLKNAEAYKVSEDWYLSCTVCGVIMKDIIYPEEYYSEYINRFYSVDAVKVEPYSYPKAQTRLNFIKSLNHTFEHILEVSSFDGVTLAAFQEYYSANVVGIEPTSSAVKTSLKAFPSLNNCIINEVFEKSGSSPLMNKTFDLVLFSHCFRHFNEPLKILEILDGITKEGSIVLVDEGAVLEMVLLASNKESIQREMFQQKAFYYTKHNLEFLFAKFNFKLIGTTYSDSKDGRYSGFLFEKHRDYSLSMDTLELSKLNSNAFLNVMKKYYYSTDDIIATLKKYG